MWWEKVLQIATAAFEYKAEREDSQKAREEEEAARAERRAKIIKDYSLNCKQCKKLACPIAGTLNRYRCSCGNQFVGPKHPL